MEKTPFHGFVTALHDRCFKWVHGSRLIYNACWEDPRIDRRLLGLDGTSRLVMITSAGCNALDYLLDGPAEVHAVDMNFRQNALLQLKMALLAAGSFEDLYKMFGNGVHESPRDVYRAHATGLPEEARVYWKKKINCFRAGVMKRSFYYTGASGDVAWVVMRYLWTTKRCLREPINALLDAETVEMQQRLYTRMEPALWRGWLGKLARNPAVMALLGVPRPQIELINARYPGALWGYVRDKMRHVFTQVPMRDNYFWRVYITGAYTPQCCPNYLKKKHADFYRTHVGRIQTHTGTLTDFLTRHPGVYSHFVLLDHQDWLAYHDMEGLEAEWRGILANSRSGTRVLMRSACHEADFLPAWVKKRLVFFPDRTTSLHRRDRVGTYGSLLFAEVN